MTKALVVMDCVGRVGIIRNEVGDCRNSLNMLRRGLLNGMANQGIQIIEHNAPP